MVVYYQILAQTDTKLNLTMQYMILVSNNV